MRTITLLGEQVDKRPAAHQRQWPYVHLLSHGQLREAAPTGLQADKLGRLAQGLCRAGDGVAVVVGKAGSGKTTALEASEPLGPRLVRHTCDIGVCSMPAVIARGKGDTVGQGGDRLRLRAGQPWRPTPKRQAK
jgi:hypothetical protein